MKNRVETYLAELYPTEAPAILPTPPVTPGTRKLTESTIIVGKGNRDFRMLATHTLADVIESLDGRAMEYQTSTTPKPFNREKFIAYHANPEVWDVPHMYRAGALELILGEQTIMPIEYVPSAPLEDYDPDASDAVPDEPGAHVVWNFDNQRFDGYILKETAGKLRFIVLSDKPEAKDALTWMTSQVAQQFSTGGYRVNIVTKHDTYSEEL